MRTRDLVIRSEIRAKVEIDINSKEEKYEHIAFECVGTNVREKIKNDMGAATEVYDFRSENEVTPF